MARAISVLPVPVGLTITPRRPAPSQAATAASWSGGKRDAQRRTVEEALGVILEREPVLGRVLAEARVVQRLGAPGADALVPGEVARHARGAGRGEEEGAAIELESGAPPLTHGRAPGRRGAARSGMPLVRHRDGAAARSAALTLDGGAGQPVRALVEGNAGVAGDLVPAHVVAVGE